MTGLQLLRQRLATDERGIAMIVAIGVMLVASILIGVMFETVLREQTSTARARNVTNGRQAAEAGIDRAIYDLSSNGANWDGFVTSYPCVANPPATNPPATCYQGTVGGGSYVGSIKNDPVDPTNYRIITMRGQFPAGRTGDQRVLKVRVTKAPPDAFKYAMFSSRGITIHHHAASYLSPQVSTTAVHSNGFINIDYSAQFFLDTMEAVGTLTFSAGGGQYPGGAIPPDGYPWYDPLNQSCYPANFPTQAAQGLFNAGSPPQYGTYPNVSCPYKYAGNAEITGNISAGQVKQSLRGIVKGDPNGLTLPTHVDIGTRNGDIYTSRYQGPTGNPLTKATDVCSNCNKGAQVQAGQVAGNITIDPGFVPKVINFPVLNYPQFQTAAAAQTSAPVSPTAVNPTPAGTHVFPNCTTFINTITGSTGDKSAYRWVQPDGTLQSAANNSNNQGMPDAILLDNGSQASNNNNAAYYYIATGGCDFEWDDMRTLTAKGACTAAGKPGCSGSQTASATASAPLLIIKGSLVVPNGGITAKAPMAIIGPDTPTNFVIKANGNTTPPTPLSINDSAMLASGSYPGVMAAGGSIDTHDFDSDSKWLTTSTYEWWKASPVYIRGIDISATYVDTKTMTPQNQHFHNDDPKNSIKVYGSQVGGTLHNCMNFTFMYDPVVKNVPFATSPGTVKVTDYQELTPGSLL